MCAGTSKAARGGLVEWTVLKILMYHEGVMKVCLGGLFLVAVSLCEFPGHQCSAKLGGSPFAVTQQRCASLPGLCGGDGGGSQPLVC